MEWIELGKLANIELGKTPARKTPEYWNGEYTWVAIADMKEKYISNSKEKISALSLQETNIKIVPKGTVIMSFKLSIGKRAIAEKDLYTNEAIAAFHIKNHDILNFEYLYYALGFVDLLKDTDKAVMGKTLNKAKLKNIKIPVPSLETQKQIVEVLDKAQNLIDNRKKQIQLLDNLIESVFYDMFGDPVLNEKGWEAKKLDEFSDVKSSKRVYISECVSEGIPFYRGTEIAKLSKKEEVVAELFVTEKHYKALKNDKGVPKIGDLLLPSICSKGEVWRVDISEPFYFKDGRVLWIGLEEENINSEYLQYCLSQILMQNFERISSGSTFAEMKIFILKVIEIPLPPIYMQNQFAQKVQAIENQKQLLENSLKLLEDNYNSLMQRAFKGELF